MNLFKKLFCSHEFEMIRITFGDENNTSLPNRKVEKCKICEKIKYSPMSENDWKNYNIPRYRVIRYLFSENKLMDTMVYETCNNYDNIVEDYTYVGYVEEDGHLICKINKNLHYIIDIQKIN